MEINRLKRCSRPRMALPRRSLRVAILLLCGLASVGAGPAGPAPSPINAYDKALEAVVQGGRVNYAALKKGPAREHLEHFLKAVAEEPVPEGRAERVAWYVNAYNALVLRSVVQHGIPKSVLNVDDFFKAREHTVAGQERSLDELEKKVLNPFAKDPRTHFVLVCAAVGCPILEATPFRGQGLERRLERATRRYLESPQGAQTEPGLLRLSKIFDWYAADFGGPDGVRRFVTKRLGSTRKDLLGPDFQVEYLEYDWTLNRQG